MRKFLYLISMTILCLGLTACGDDDEDNGAVVPPSSNGGTQQTLPDPEGTVTAKITNDGIPDNGININGSYIYMDKVNNMCVKKRNNYDYDSASITNLGKVAGLAAIINVPTEGYADKVSTSEGDGLILQLGRHYVISNPGYPGQGGYAANYYRIYIAEYIRDALGNIIGATIKYQTGTDWVQKE